jgi:hypothetical protein
MKKLLLLLLLFAGSAVFAQPLQKITLIGTVVDSADGRSLAQAEVTVFFKLGDSTFVETGTWLTDTAGQFTAYHNTVMPEFFYAVSYEGYRFAYSETVDEKLKDGAIIRRVRLVMREGKGPNVPRN